MNHKDTVTVTRRTTSPDPATGAAVSKTWTVWPGVRASLVPLRTSEAVEAWGEAAPARTATVTASLFVPAWEPLLPEATYTLDAYAVKVDGSPYTWRIQAVKVWPNFTHYLLLASI